MNDDVTASTPLLLVVDDDESVRRSLARLLTSAGYAVETFGSAAELLGREPLTGPGCLVLDVQLPGLSGLDLHARLRSAGADVSAVFVSGHGDVAMGVRAMKDGAVDFLTKPVNDVELLAAVERALARDRLARGHRAELNELRQRDSALTQREREVCALVATGLLNKQVAAVLGTSEKTVKVHRARVMTKMQAGSLADLVRIADRLGMRHSSDTRPDPGSADVPVMLPLGAAASLSTYARTESGARTG